MSANIMTRFIVASIFAYISATALESTAQSISVDLDNVATSSYTETFDLGDASWASGAFGPLTHSITGANGFVSTSIAAPSMDTTMFRGHSSFGSSAGNFTGDWITDGINSISFDVRHDWPGPVNFFSRVAPPANFPGQIAVSFVPVFPNTWTTVTLDVSATSPQLFGEGQPYAATFSNIGKVQIGVSALVPEPRSGCLVLFAVLGLGVLTRMRQIS